MLLKIFLSVKNVLQCPHRVPEPVWTDLTDQLLSCTGVAPDDLDAFVRFEFHYPNVVSACPGLCHSSVRDTALPTSVLDVALPM